jgi:hypothetical protein
LTIVPISVTPGGQSSGTILATMTALTRKRSAGSTCPTRCRSCRSSRSDGASVCASAKPRLLSPHRHQADLPASRSSPSRPCRRRHHATAGALRIGVRAAPISTSRRRTPVEQQTFCRYKAMCAYYDIGDARQAAWSYRHAYASLAVGMSASTIVVAVNTQLLRWVNL